MRKGGNDMNLQLLADFASTWQGKITSAVSKILVPLLIVACSVGMIYAVVVGIKMMKADDKSARDEAKAKLINIAIAIVAIAVMIGLFYALKNWLESEYTNGNGDLGTDLGGMFDSASVGGPLSNTLSLVKQCVSMAIFKC